MRNDKGLEVLSSARYVIDCARFVKINEKPLSQLAAQAKSFIENKLTAFEQSFHYFDDPALNAQRVLVQNAANFCFWAPEKDAPKWAIEWNGKTVGGGFGLWAVMDRALSEKVPVLSAQYLATMSLSDFKNIFRPVNKVEIPDIEERWKNFREVGVVLLEKFNGQAIELVRQAGGNAEMLVQLIADNFHSYNDIATYAGHTIYFYKRAQVCASEIDASGQKLIGIDKLTAFADYKIPQLLRSMDILVYEPSLANRIENYELIPAGSAEEVEIRAGTVVAVERIRALIPQYNSVQIDNALWLLTQDQSASIRPYHRTKTIYY